MLRYLTARDPRELNTLSALSDRDRDRSAGRVRCETVLA